MVTTAKRRTAARAISMNERAGGASIVSAAGQNRVVTLTTIVATGRASCVRAALASLMSASELCVVALAEISSAGRASCVRTALASLVSTSELCVTALTKVAAAGIASRVYAIGASLVSAGERVVIFTVTVWLGALVTVAVVLAVTNRLTAGQVSAVVAVAKLVSASRARRMHLSVAEVAVTSVAGAMVTIYTGGVTAGELCVTSLTHIFLADLANIMRTTRASKMSAS